MFRPKDEPQLTVDAQVTAKRIKALPCDPRSIERGVRQLLADKVSGNLAGIWLLVAEHLRLGTWDLVCGWTRKSPQRVEPRLAMQLVHEAAICTTGIRAERTLHGRGGFELASGLPFIATDQVIHELLNEHTVDDSMRLQVALGKIRLASGHYRAKVLAIDPHRVTSHSKRSMRKRVDKRGGRPFKMAQTFWLLDADTHQPICFTTATAAVTVVEATPTLIDLGASILQPAPDQTLIVADAEHFSGELVNEIHERSGFDLLVPIPNQPAHRRRFRAIPEEKFQRRWAGFATAKLPFEIKRRHPGTHWQFVERCGETPADWYYRGFLCTTDRDEVEAMALEFPKRWHIEEFFNAHQALGWKRAGTMNLNIRYGQMTMALIAQTALYQLRTRLGEPYCSWDADHLAKDLFFRLEGDIHVKDDTIVVTYYNAPNVSQLRAVYENLPDRLTAEKIQPTVPWLYNYKLDFRFR